MLFKMHSAQVFCVCLIFFSFSYLCKSQLATKKVRIVAPSSQVKSFNDVLTAVNKLKTDFADATYSKYVAQNGVLNLWRDYYAGTPEERAIDLQDAVFNDTQNSIIWSLRGGRNGAELFEYFPTNLSNQIKRELLFFGFSDITALHYFFSNYYANIKTIHGDNANGVSAVSHAVNYQLIKDIINGKVTKIEDLKPLNTLASNVLRIENTNVLGGNLALTQRSLKTQWQPNFNGRIVILEEVGETPEQVVKFLDQIVANGLFNGTKAIVFGQVYDTSKNENALAKNDPWATFAELEELMNYYNSKKYFNITVDFFGLALIGVPTFPFLDIQAKIGVQDLPVANRKQVALIFYSDEEVTRLEAALLHLYQSKYLDKGANVIIIWQDASQRQQAPQSKFTHLEVLQEFAKFVNIPVFKSESFGHLSRSLPIPLRTASALYYSSVGCPLCEKTFTLEVNPI